MTLPIFYNPEINASNSITLNEDTSRHVVQVLRMKPGEQLQLTDGTGTLATVAIADDHKKKCSITIIDRQHKPKSERKISIAISLLKNANRFEWFLEKATEIGVTDIFPLLCHRTEKQHFRFARMNNILIAAMLQSQQVWLPVLHEPTHLQQVISSSDYFNKLIAHCVDNDKRSIKSFSSSLSSQILIGPEGDFTDDEIQRAVGAGYEPVTLGDTRLRTETAGIVAATLLCTQ